MATPKKATANGNHKDTGTLVKNARARLGIDQKRLAEAMGISRGCVSVFEAKRDSRVSTLAKIADALGLELVIELR